MEGYTFPRSVEKCLEVATDLSGITKWFDTNLVDLNRYRKNSGDGRSVCQGLVYKRDGTYSESRQSWRHPELLAMIREFARKHVDVPWESVQINQNYQTAPHVDEGNRGLSTIVGFGDYVGGHLGVDRGEAGISFYNIKHRPLRFYGCRHKHWTQPFTGNRYSLVFFNIEVKSWCRVLRIKYEPYYDGERWWLLRWKDDGVWEKLDKEGDPVEEISFVR